MNAVKFGVLAVAAGLAAIAGAADLPDGYQRVEYIESKGTLLALTGLHATDDLVTRIGIMYKTNGGWWFYGDGAPGYRFFGSGTTFYFDLGSDSYRCSSGGLSASEIYHLELGNHYIENLTTAKLICGKKPGSVSFTERAWTMQLFRSSDYGRVYYLQTFRPNAGGVLEKTHDYVPCYETDGEGRIGLYDTVAGEFLTVAGLTKGGDYVAKPRTIVAVAGTTNAGGTIAADKTTASAGEIVTVTATPVASCRVRRWFVEGDDYEVVSDNLYGNELKLRIGESPVPLQVFAEYMPNDLDGNVIQNGSFEEENTQTAGYGSASCRAWGSGNYCKAGSPFLAQQTLDGAFAAYIQTLGAEVKGPSQTFYAPAGKWTLSIKVAGRSGYSGSTFGVYVDDELILTETTTAATLYALTAPVTLAETPDGKHTIYMTKKSPSGDKATAFDEVRLVSESSDAHTLVVASTAQYEAAREPALGTYHVYQPGDAVVCTCEESVTIGEMTYVCAGWKLYGWNAETQAFEFDDADPDMSGSGNVAAFTFGTKSVKLVWQVETESQADVPPVADQLTVKSLAPETATLSVRLANAGAASGRPGATACDIYAAVREQGAETWGEAQKVVTALGAGAVGTWTLTELQPQTAYEVKVFARNPDELESDSVTIALTTLEVRVPRLTVGVNAGMTEIDGVSPAYGDSELVTGQPVTFSAPKEGVGHQGYTLCSLQGYEYTVVDYNGKATNVKGTDASFVLTPQNGDVITVTWKWQVDGYTAPEMWYRLDFTDGVAPYNMVVDGDLSNYIEAQNRTLIADMGTPRLVTLLRLAPRHDVAWRCTFTLMSANDPNGPWTTLARQGETLTANAFTYFPTGATEPLRYYKFDGMAANYNNFGELRFHGTGLFLSQKTIDAHASETLDSAYLTEVPVTGTLQSVPAGATGAHLYAYAARDDFGDNRAAWQANGKVFDFGEVAAGADYSGTLTGLDKGIWHCRVFAVADGTVAASQATGSFTMGAKHVYPTMYVSKKNLATAYDGSVTSYTDDSTTPGWWIFDLSDIKSWQELRAIRQWPRTDAGWNGLARLRGSSVQVCYDEIDWGELVTETITKVDGARTIKVVSGEPSGVIWEQFRNFADLQPRTWNERKVYETLLPRVKGRRPRYLRISNYSYGSNCEFEFCTLHKPGFAIVVQ